MPHIPLLALLAVAAGAVARPPNASEDSGRGQAFNPAVLSAEARLEWEADPAGFEREHGEALEAQRRWSQDPSLGRSECLAAKKDPRSCMESRVREMSAVVRPQELAVINSYLKLLPRGISAPLPAASRPESGGAPVPSGTTPAPAPSPRSSAPNQDPKPSGAHFKAPPAANAPATPPKEISTVDEAMSWICSYVPCSRA